MRHIVENTAPAFVAGPLTKGRDMGLTDAAKADDDVRAAEAHRDSVEKKNELTENLRD